MMSWTSQMAGRGCFGGAPFDTESKSIVGNDARKPVTDGYPLEQVHLLINREGATRMWQHIFAVMVHSAG
jgi:hypothetical protein